MAQGGQRLPSYFNIDRDIPQPCMIRDESGWPKSSMQLWAGLCQGRQRRYWIAQWVLSGHSMR